MKPDSCNWDVVFAVVMKHRMSSMNHHWDRNILAIKSVLQAVQTDHSVQSRQRGVDSQFDLLLQVIQVSDLDLV